jgi:hypothetical protein
LKTRLAEISSKRVWALCQGTTLEVAEKINFGANA